MENEYNLPEGIDIFDYNLIKDFGHYPAIENVGKDVYLIKDNEILCTGTVGSSYRGQAIVYLDNDHALSVFSHDYAVQSVGKFAAFPFYISTGWYVTGRFDEGNEERGVGITVVDKMAFDFGIASSMRYSHIPGFGNRLNKEILSDLGIDFPKA